MSISEVLAKFDVVDRKGFDAHAIISALSTVDEQEKN